MALGASPQTVMRSVLGRSLRLGATGVLTGGAAALPLTWFLSNQLYGVSPNDPAVFGLVGVLILFVVLVAAWIPARRVLGVETLQALQS
jgi:ABC-type antimicrobial peptide transport system permease subunit